MSKFDGLLKSRQSGYSVTRNSSTPKKQKETSGEPEPAAPTPRVGRPRAKRSDPNYLQVTAYLRRATYTAARKRLFDEEREFSELVEDLVAEWLKGK